MKADERLRNILFEKCIRAFPVFGTGSLRVVCFSECTPAGMTMLLNEGRYAALGIAFDKDFVFRKGGGPALYIRGDELHDWREATGIPDRLRARATKLWPGRDPLPSAVGSDGWMSVEAPDNDLDRRSEWMHEREWRILGIGDPPGFRFDLTDVAFVLVRELPNGWPHNQVLSLGGDLSVPLKSVSELLQAHPQAS